jgi:hypothetical protein
MNFKTRRSVLGQFDDRGFAYAGLFGVCALLSSLGGGALGLFLFIPAALAISLIGSGRGH